MKRIFIAGNWKSNKTVVEAVKWLQTFSEAWVRSKINAPNCTIVICAPFTSLLVLKEQIGVKKLPIFLGAENVSPFAEGAETGEESARMVKELADWVIIGHSERRKNFGESDDVLAKKVEQAKSVGLKIIYCVQDDRTPVPSGVDVVAYEPVWAIGTGKTDTPENANSVIARIKAKSQAATVLYGGSVTAENVMSFIFQPAINGVLPGGASLKAETFMNLILAASGLNNP